MSEFNSKEDWLRKFSRIGMASKGFVYFFVGALTLISALTGSSSISGKSGVVDFLKEQPFGNAIVIFLSIGLFGFVCWRIIQVLKNPEGDSFGHCLAYCISGGFYAFFASSILYKTFVSNNSSGTKENIISQLLASTWGSIVVALIIIALLIKAFFQFKKSFGKEFKEKLKISDFKGEAERIIKYLGVIGYFSRGIVVLTMAFLFGKALLMNDASKSGGTKEAFQLLDSSPSSSIILIIISAGLALYGLFMIAKAKYKAIPSL